MHLSRPIALAIAVAVTVFVPPGGSIALAEPAPSTPTTITTTPPSPAPHEAEDPALSLSECPPGRAVSDETEGHCCWPGQVWARSRSVCVGIPECPSGLVVDGESCAPPPRCPPAQRVTDDTVGHCCFPGQAWSRRRAACVGIPQCERGLVAVGERCEAAPAPTAAAPTPREREPAHEGLVPVLFEANIDRYQYRVSVGPKSCETPCKLYLRPGRATLSVDGDGSFSKDLLIPTQASRMRLQHAATGEVIAGGTLLALSTAMMLTNAGVGSLNLGAVIAFGWALGPITACRGNHRAQHRRVAPVGDQSAAEVLR